MNLLQNVIKSEIIFGCYLELQFKMGPMILTVNFTTWKTDTVKEELRWLSNDSRSTLLDIKTLQINTY